MSAIYDTKAFCHNHPQEPAVAICFQEKAFICPDCLVEDKHLNNGVVTLKKLNNFLQEKKEILIQHHEKALSNSVNNIQTKEITKTILTKIEPIINEIVAAELKEQKKEPQDIKELLKKVDNLIVNNQATGSVEVVEELEKATRKLESTNSQLVGEKNVNDIAKKVSDLLQGTSLEDSDRQEQIKNISIDIGADFDKFTLLPGKDSYSGLEVIFGRKSDNMSSFCSELSKFKRLEELQLDFCFCTTIHDDKIQELSHTLKNMESLTKLQIKFWDAMSVSDRGLKELSSALKNLTSLTELSLDFSSCGVIRDVEVKDLIFTIKSLDTLTHLQLDFSGIDSISEEGKNELDLLLKSYKQL